MSRVRVFLMSLFAVFIIAALWGVRASAQDRSPDLRTLRTECVNASGTGSPQAVMGACMKVRTLCGIPCILPGDLGISTVISGLAWGSQIWLKVDGSTVMSTGNGPISIALGNPRYSVSVAKQPRGQSCAVENGAGAAVTVPWTRVVVKCTGGISVEGVVSGLTQGEHLRLVNERDALTITENGRFIFDAQLLPGEPYSISIGTPPPANDDCVLSGNTSGTANNADITDLQVKCVPSPPAEGVVMGVEDPDLFAVPKAVADAAGGQTDQCTVTGKYLVTRAGDKLWFVANSCGGSGGQPMDLVLSTRAGTKSVLSEFGLGMTIKYVTTNGMPNIVVQHGGPGISETEDYRFSGTKYISVASFSAPAR